MELDQGEKASLVRERDLLMIRNHQPQHHWGWDERTLSQITSGVGRLQVQGKPNIITLTIHLIH